MKNSIVVLMALVILISCKDRKGTATSDRDTTDREMDTSSAKPFAQPLVAHAEALIAATKNDTTVSGAARFDTIQGNKVRMNLEVSVEKMANRTISVHLHEHGSCGSEGNDAHGHWNPDNSPHGKWGSSQFHAGDIGNIKLDNRGKGTLVMETDRWTLGGHESTNILNKALIVHSGVDDYTTQPTGNAGSRIGCGVIR